MNIDWNNVLNTALLPALGTMAVVVANWALPRLPGATGHLFGWIQAHTANIKNQTVKSLLSHVTDLAQQKVMALEQTEVAYLMQQVKGGQITKAALPVLLAGVKQRAIDSVKGDLNAQGLMSDAAAVFGGDQSNFTKWLGDVIESHVSMLPPSGMDSVKLPPASVAQAPAPVPVPEPAAIPPPVSAPKA